VFARVCGLSLVALCLSACSGFAAHPFAGDDAARTAARAPSAAGYLYFLGSRDHRLRAIDLGDGATIDANGDRRGGGGIAVDSAQNVYESSDSVRVFDSSLHLLRSFTPASGGYGEGIAVDSVGQVYLGVYFGQGEYAAVEVFAANASGSASPSRTISGPLTLILDHPVDVKVDGAGYIYVSTANSILVFAPDADGDQAPVRDISGPLTKLGDDSRIALGIDGNIYVANGLKRNVHDMLVFPETANGNVAPIRKLDSHPYGAAIALGPGGIEYLGPGLGRGRGHNDGFAVYEAGAAGRTPPAGYVGHSFSDSGLPEAAALEFPWTP
jgi:hypothetical protein